MKASLINVLASPHWVSQCINHRYITLQLNLSILDTSGTADVPISEESSFQGYIVCYIQLGP